MQWSEGMGGWWWLRSPEYESSELVRIVYSDGDVDCENNVARKGEGGVPALSVTIAE